MSAAALLHGPGHGAWVRPAWSAGLAWVIAACCLLGAGAAQAQDQDRSGRLDLPPAEVRAAPPAAARTIGGSGPCVQVDIAGDRAGHLECASEALQGAVEAMRNETQAARQVSVPGAGSPDVQVGVASRAGARLRLRENFGVSVRPPAVAPPLVTDPSGPRQ